MYIYIYMKSFFKIDLEGRLCVVVSLSFDDYNFFIIKDIII